MKTEQFNITNEDCMELLKRSKDNEYDLAIVDVPYGIGAGDYKRGGTQYGQSKAKCKEYTRKDWDNNTPSKEYWDELLRVSKNQIVWGANHFISDIPFNSSCWVVWDKLNGEGSGYADCELAWTSFKTAVRRYSFRWAGMLQGDMKNKQERIHPTQKPIQLYEWLFKNYAEPNQKILDTHLGSMSIAIALDKVNKMDSMNLHLTGCELDLDYYNDGVKRVGMQTRQKTIFDTQ